MMSVVVVSWMILTGILLVASLCLVVIVRGLLAARRYDRALLSLLDRRGSFTLTGIVASFDGTEHCAVCTERIQSCLRVMHERGLIAMAMVPGEKPEFYITRRGVVCLRKMGERSTEPEACTHAYLHH